MQTDQKKLFENYAVNLFEIEEGRFIYFIWGEERGWILPKEYQDQWLVWLGEKSFWTAFSLLEEAWLKYYRKEDYSFINLAGESYRDCLLSYSFSPHGYCCEVHFPDGEIFYTPSERHFSRALDVAKKIIDDHHDNDCTSIKDNDLGIYINPDDFSLLPRRLVHFEHLLGDEKSPLRQLAMLLMMSFDDQGTTRFFRQFLQDIFGFKTGFLTRHLNMLMRMGIMNYKEYPNSDYPLEFRIGPAWLDIAGAGESLNFEESEIQALLEGESFGKDKSYFEGLPHSVFSNQFNNIGEQIFQHSKGAFITYFQDNEYPQYRSRWHSGVWEHYAYESPEHCGEKIEYMTWREFKKFCQEYYSQPIVFDYKRTKCTFCPFLLKNKIHWLVQVEFACPTLQGKFYSSVYSKQSDAKDSAYELIDQGDVKSLEINIASENENHEIQRACKIIEESTVKNTKILQKIITILIMKSRDGKVGIWKIVLAQSLGITPRVFANRLKKLQQLGCLEKIEEIGGRNKNQECRILIKCPLP